MLEPFAIACMVQVYFKVIDGQQPDPQWDDRLSKLSGKFRQLKERALDTVGAAPAQAATHYGPPAASERAS